MGGRVIMGLYEIMCMKLLKLIFTEYSCFTMLCYFLQYNKVNQLYVHIYTQFFRFPSHLGHHKSIE